MEVSNKTLHSIIYIFWTVIFVLLFSTREGVGSDYWAYVKIFENGLDESVEVAFKLYGYVLYDIVGGDGQFSVALLAVIMVLSTVICMKLAHISPIYVPLFFLVNFILYTSILRQGVASIVTGLILFSVHGSRNYIVYQLINTIIFHKSQSIFLLIRILLIFRSKIKLYIILSILFTIAILRVPTLSGLLTTLLNQLDINSWRTVYFLPGGRFYIPLHYGKLIFLGISLAFLIRNEIGVVRNTLVVFGFILLFISELGVLSARFLFTYTFLFFMYFFQRASRKQFFSEVSNIIFLVIFISYCVFSLVDELSVHNGSVYSNWDIIF